MDMAARPEGRPATIFDVAAAAAVSQATVSRVVNGKSSVDPAIAQRVLDVVAQLGYRPSATARNLARGSTQTVAVVVPDLANPMFQEVLRGVTHAAAAAGYRVLVADTEESIEGEPAIALEARRRCDAVVLCAPRMPAEELLELLPLLSPVVLVNRSIEGVAEVAADYERAAAVAVEHLAGLGHTRIAYLAGPVSSQSNRRRLRGIERAAAADTALDITMLECGPGLDDGSRAAERVVASGVTAVIAFNDLVAFGLLARLRELGVDVPREVSVTGFDDIAFSAFATPPLTTMAVQGSVLGSRAWTALFSEISGGEPGRPEILAPTLVVRSSTGPVPA
jgi:LacI family transcriptional regulator